jgi:signal transduction histidine kinase
MGSPGPVNPIAASEPAGRRPASSLATLLRAATRAPFTARAWRDQLFCLAEVALEAVILVVPLALVGLSLGAQIVTHARRASPGHPAHSGQAGQAGWGLALLAAFVVILFLLVIMLPRAARWLGAVQRRLTARLLGERIAAPAPPRRASGAFGRAGAMLRDGPGWRAAACLLVKLPVTVAELYAVAFAALGLSALTYPFWWPLFRNHPAGTHLAPVSVLTPFGTFHIATYAGTLLAFAVGAAMLLAAPWVARGAARADAWLMRGMLGPGRLAQRVADLEQTRALAVEDSAATLRRLERDLHDGAQIRLATLAMNLGMAREKLAADGDPEVRELVDAAHQGAKDALADLRNLARGIHPPALDNGLADALATLAASSATPAELTTSLPERPAPAIETIAYFCAAELLANAAKHSGANWIGIALTEEGDVLTLRVTDDGSGGADPAGGSGLSGLAQRVRTVDGRLDIASPPGGPTQVTITLPMHA